MTEPGSSDDGTKGVQGAWAVGKPTRVDYAQVVEALNAYKLVGEASVFERGPHVPVTHMAYFKPLMGAFLVELKSKDRRSAKEWEYINEAGKSLGTGLVALEVVKERTGIIEDMGRRLALAETSFRAAIKVLAMSLQYFRDITEQGIEEGRQMAYLVEQGNEAVNYVSYRTAREALTTKLEKEAAKKLAKSRLERETNAKKRMAVPMVLNKSEKKWTSP